jgi:hypothetical protein
MQNSKYLTTEFTEITEREENAQAFLEWFFKAIAHLPPLRDLCELSG